MTKHEFKIAQREWLNEIGALQLRLKNMHIDLIAQDAKLEKLEKALERIRDCDFVITLPDRMDAVRTIAREALE
jgi:ribosomal protein L1